MLNKKKYVTYKTYIKQYIKNRYLLKVYKWDIYNKYRYTILLRILVRIYLLHYI